MSKILQMLFNFMSLHLYYPHFTDEETEAQRHYITYRSLRSSTTLKPVLHSFYPLHGHCSPRGCSYPKNSKDPFSVLTLLSSVHFCNPSFSGVPSCLLTPFTTSLVCMCLFHTVPSNLTPHLSPNFQTHTGLDISQTLQVQQIPR